MGRGVRPGRGGICGLAAFLDEHGGAVEADLARFYPADDLRDLWRPGGRLTWRRLKLLIDHLPMESATKTSVRDSLPDDALAAASEPQHGPWAREHFLLANMVDLLGTLISVQVQRAGVKSKMPEPVPRPGVKKAAKPGLNSEQIAYLQRIRERRDNTTE